MHANLFKKTSQNLLKKLYGNECCKVMPKRGIMEFSPLKCLNSENTGTLKEKCAVVLLNMNKPTSSFSSKFCENFINIWNSGSLRVCADGGANFLHELMQKHELRNGQTIKYPSFISGDFDSITDDTKSFFDKKTKMIETPDQDETDFTKAIQLVSTNIKESNIDIVLVMVIGVHQGRFDHVMANINTLYKAQDILPRDVRICKIFPESFVCLLHEGKSRLLCNSGNESDWCGLVPINGETTVTTTGLKWNLNNTKMSFGGIISTSNKIDESQVVTIQSNKPLLWIMGQNILI